MPNYANGKIYKLVSNHTDDIYIGSSTQSLAVRKAEHVKHYKRYLDEKFAFITSFEIIKHGDVDIILLENYPCESKEELHSRERHWIEKLDCVNKRIPGRNHSESCKAYYERNKDKYLKSIHCMCGANYTHQNRARHIKTVKHKNYVSSVQYFIDMKDNISNKMEKHYSYILSNFISK